MVLVEIERKTVHEIEIVTLSGELDEFNLEPITAKLDALLDSGVRRLVFNLGGLRFINSSALAYMLKTRGRLKDAGGELVITRPSRFFHSAITTLGTERLFTTFENDDDAVEYLRGR